MGTCDRPTVPEMPLSGPPPGWLPAAEDTGASVAWGELSADQADGFAPVDRDAPPEAGGDDAQGYGHGV